MRLIFLVFLCTFLFNAVALKTDDGLPNRDNPNYTGVDPKIVPIVEEYKSLATKHRIIFTNNVTVGFTDINHGKYVGVCYYGDNWREIDVDKKYWNDSSEMTRRTLVFHELTHCYCTRKHDYGKDKEYPEAKQSSSLVKNGAPIYFFVADGFFPDGCPLSIMYPYVVVDECMLAHKDFYDEEMFDRCEPF